MGLEVCSPAKEVRSSLGAMDGNVTEQVAEGCPHMFTDDENSHNYKVTGAYDQAKNEFDFSCEEVY